MAEQQLMFDWDAPGKKTADSNPEERRRSRQRFHLRLAAVKWLLEQEPEPAAFALNVVTRISKFMADIAAFWSQPVRNPQDEGPAQILKPVRTAIIQACMTREECWPDYARSTELVPKLRRLKEDLLNVENRIRGEEPMLRDGGALFEEYAVWRYEDSQNPEYHRLRREINRTEHALYRGTQFERIRQAALADHLYLAVPAGLIQPDELADGWGLLWVADDLTVTVAHPAGERNCLDCNRLHLVQNIAAAAVDNVRYCLGVQQKTDGSYYLTLPPRGHRKPRRLHLND